MPTTPKISKANVEHSAVSGDDGADPVVLHPREIDSAESEAASAGPKAVAQQEHSLPAMLPAGVLLDQLPDGAALLNHEFRILWCNRQLREFTAQTESDRGKTPVGPLVPSNRPADSLIGKSFYEAFGTPEIIGPDFCPLHTALGSGELAKSSLRVGEKTYYEVQARPVVAEESDAPEPAGRQRPRHLGRGAPATETECDLPGRPRAGRLVARKTFCT